MEKLFIWQKMSRPIYLGFRRRSSELARHLIAGDYTIQEVKELLLMEHHDWDENFVLLYRRRRLEDDSIVENIIDESDSDVIFDVEYPSEEEVPSGNVAEDNKVFIANNNQSQPIQGSDATNIAEEFKYQSEASDNETFKPQVESNVNEERKRESEASAAIDEQKRKSEACKVTVIYNGEKHEALVRTLGELKNWVNRNLMDGSITAFNDLTVEGHSILNFASHILIQDILAGATDQSVEVVVADKDESGDDAVELLRNIFAIQVERDRIAHINQMAYNSKLMITSLSSLASFVDESFPELREELEMVIKKHKIAN